MVGSPASRGDHVIPSDRDPETLPPPSRLDAVVAHLERAGSARKLVAFVERWAQEQDPSDTARLAEARALLRLGLADKAWIRLRELIEVERPSLAAVEAAAELFIARGWTARARELLGRAMADHPDRQDLQNLWDRAAEPTPPPPELDRDALGDADPERLLPVAHAHLIAGQTRTARAVLEHLHRAHPDHAGVSDLRWAVQQDHVPHGVTVAELVERWGPPPAGPARLADDDESTESITQEEVRRILEVDEPPVAGASFPSLFRGAENDLPVEDTEEVTATAIRRRWDDSEDTMDPDATGITEVDRGRDPAREDPEEDEGGDTRILRVMHRDATRQDRPLHRPSPAASPDFDLQAYRAEMGMGTEPGAGAEPGIEGAPMPLAAHLESGFGDDLEDEDDDLVVLRRPDAPGKATPEDLAGDDPTMSQIGREVAHLLGGSGRMADPPAGAQSTGTAEEPPVPVPEREPDTAAEPPTGSESPAAPTARQPSPEGSTTGALPIWVGLLVALLAGGLLLLALLVLAFWALGGA